jgi:DNA polymerase type B, organellar and viral
MRVPEPFLWGFYDGKNYIHFDRTDDFVEHVRKRNIILLAHNGGKFDFMYLIKYVSQTRAQIINNRVVSMTLDKCELRDSFAAVPEGMGKIQKMQMDINKMEKSIRHLHMPEILERNRTDCIYLYNLMARYRKRAGIHKTIASNALAFSKSVGVDPGKTNNKFDREFREYYFGGRTECFQPGTHHDITVLDMHSAYPRAMMEDHSSGDQRDFHTRDDLNGLTREIIQRSFITLTCEAAGCFPIRGGGFTGLIFPHEYNQYKVTGWEYLAASDLGLMKNVDIQSVSYSDKTINFIPYITHWYQQKQEHSGKDEFGELLNPIDYTIDKIMMNSLYGKLSQNIARYHDYRIVPAATMTCSKYVEGAIKRVCSNCYQKDMEHGWEHCLDFEQSEIHKRESLWRYKFLYGDEWESKRLYKNVATGSSVTGYCRASLLRAIHALGPKHVIYTDTDSLMVKATADLSKLSISDKLGDWGIEESGAPLGYFNGKKLYGILKKNGKHKLASKGAKMSFADMRVIAEGQTVTWQSPAPSFSLLSGKIPGSDIDPKKLFVIRQIRSTTPLSAT